MEGQIIKIIKEQYYILTKEILIICSLRGILRKDNLYPVVGDYVIINEKDKTIEKILPRTNIFKRPKVANINQAFIVTSLINPKFSPNLLDKLLVNMYINNVKPIICLTKKDLIKDNNLDNIINYYSNIYTVIYNTEVDKILKLIKGNVSVFTGQSGVGKSTLLNKLNPNLNLKVGEVDNNYGRGHHTTREVSLFIINNGKVLDTPGFSAYDLDDVDNKIIKDAFIEFKNYPCTYKDCTHTNEKECNVKKNVLNNNILKSRYENYLSFINNKNK